MVLHSETFAQHIAEQRPRLHRLAVRMVGGDAAEDVLQQACLRAWQQRTTFAHKAAFATWLYRLTVNCCLDVLRTRHRFAASPLEEEAVPDSDIAEEVVNRLDRDSRLSALARALEELRPADRQLLQLRLVDGLDYAHIAALLQVSPGTVGSRLTRARARLHTLVLAKLAAILLVVLVIAALAQPPALAELDLFLRQVVLRFETPAGVIAAPALHVSLDEAQQRVLFPIRKPLALPAGYDLAAVELISIHAFADGPSVVLHYQSSAGPSSELSVMELQASEQAPEPVPSGAATTVQIPDGPTALFIDGQWTADGWQPGTLSRLILEQDSLVLQLQGDPRAGWTAARLVEVAASLR